VIPLPIHCVIYSLHLTGQFSNYSCIYSSNINSTESASPFSHQGNVYKARTPQNGGATAKRAMSSFLGEFAKLWKVTTSFVMSVCLSVRPFVRLHGRLGSHWTDFHEIWYISIFRISVEKIQDLLISDKNIGYFTSCPLYIYDTISRNSS